MCRGCSGRVGSGSERWAGKEGRSVLCGKQRGKVYMLWGT